MPAERAAGPVLELSDRSVASMLPPRGPRSHKGTHGTLLCLTGSLDYAGAALLGAAAALRAGTGLVVLAVPASLQALFAGRVLEATTMGLPEADAGDPADDAAAEAVAERHPDAVLCGSGWRDSPGNARLLHRLLHQSPPDPDAAAPGRLAPMVIDGTGLNLLARDGDWWPTVRRACILTPHPGEFARLAGSAVGDDDDERRERATEAARRFGQVVVLKGARTLVAAPDGRTAVAPFENPGLATAGTGDVLAGIVAGLLAQGVPAFEAACAGVHIHGTAGERVREHLGDAGMLASDLLPEIPRIRRRLAELRERPEPRLGFGSRGRG